MSDYPGGPEILVCKAGGRERVFSWDCSCAPLGMKGSTSKAGGMGVHAQTGRSMHCSPGLVGGSCGQGREVELALSEEGCACLRDHLDPLVPRWHRWPVCAPGLQSKGHGLQRSLDGYSSQQMTQVATEEDEAILLRNVERSKPQGKRVGTTFRGNSLGLAGSGEASQSVIIKAEGS